MSQQTVLTGITTTGSPHLGNYVGAIKPAIRASRDPGVNSYFFLADYHALIKCTDPEQVRQSTLEIAATWLALGLAVPTVVLCWVLIPHLMGEFRAQWWQSARAFAVLFVPANFLSLALLARDQGRLQFTAYNVQRIFAPLAYLFLLVILWLADSVSISTVVAASLIAVWVLAAFQVGRGRGLAKVAVRAEWLRRLARRGASFHGAAGLMILSTQADRIVALRLFDDATVGYYVVAFALSTFGLTAVTLAVHTVLLPTVSRAALGSREALMARTERSHASPVNHDARHRHPGPDLGGTLLW
jgi:O-antigen/teichoic acid export membrane protein